MCDINGLTVGLHPPVPPRADPCSVNAEARPAASAAAALAGPEVDGVHRDAQSAQVHNSDLARRLGVHERIVRSMLDPQHATKAEKTPGGAGNARETNDGRSARRTIRTPGISSAGACWAD